LPEPFGKDSTIWAEGDLGLARLPGGATINAFWACQMVSV
jgi:hypothetical protein